MPSISESIRKRDLTLSGEAKTKKIDSPPKGQPPFPDRHSVRSPIQGGTTNNSFREQPYFPRGRVAAGRVGAAGRAVDGFAAVGLAGDELAAGAAVAGGRVAGVVVGTAAGRAIFANSASNPAA